MTEDSFRQWFGVVFIPVAVIVATVIHQRSEADLAERRHRDEVALKFIELSWDAIEARDSARTMNATKVLALFDPRMALEMQMIALRDTIPMLVTSVSTGVGGVSDAVIATAGLMSVSISVEGTAGGNEDLPLWIARDLGTMRGDTIPVRWKRYTGKHFRVRSTIVYGADYEPVAMYIRNRYEQTFPPLTFEMIKSLDSKGIWIRIGPGSMLKD